jgi:hypothetical protein
VALCASNPLSTQGDVAAALCEESGIATFAVKGEDTETFFRHIGEVLDTHPHITMDDGADMVSELHKDRADQIAEIFGGTEVRGELPLSAPLYELDGTSAGSRDPATRPTQNSMLRPLAGGAVVLGADGDLPVMARLSYRRIWSATADWMQGEPDSGVNDEKVGLTASAQFFRRRLFLSGGVRYNLNICPSILGFGSTELEYDEFQDLDLRFSPSGGLGWRIIDNERTMFNVLGGASLNREFFATGLNRTSGEALVGQEFTHKLTKIASLAQKFIIYPNLTRRGDYRMSFDASAVTTLRKWLGWQFSVSDRLLSNPLPGRKKNDLLFTSGIRLTFAK